MLYIDYISIQLRKNVGSYLSEAYSLLGEMDNPIITIEIKNYNCDKGTQEGHRACQRELG